MKPFLFLAILGATSCATKPTGTHPVREEHKAIRSNWKNCGVANAVAQQFAKALLTLGQLDRYVHGGSVVFRVCDEAMECNEAAQPFPAGCKTAVALPGLSSTNLLWSSSGIPPQRQAPYAILLVQETDQDVIFRSPLNYHFNGSPVRPDGQSAGVLAGVSENRGDAPRIRVAVSRLNASTTKDSFIEFGEREIDSPAHISDTAVPAAPSH